MKRTLLAILGFAGAAIAGYIACFLAYIFCTSVLGWFDREGAWAMGVAFGIGPLVALLCGMVAVIVIAVRR